MRVNFRGDLGRLEREASVAARLPAEVRYPGVLAHGADGVIEWVLVRRVPGTALSRAWPGLSWSQRRRAVTELAESLSALHAVDTPGLPEDRDLAPPHVLPLDRILDQIASVARLAVLGLSRHLGALVDEPPRRPVDAADPKDRRNHLRALLS